MKPSKQQGDKSPPNQKGGKWRADQQKGTSQKGATQQCKQKGESHNKGGGKKASPKGGKTQNGDNALPAVVVNVTVVWKGRHGHTGMSIGDDNVILSVLTGSPPSLAGVMRTMQILRVDGTDVSTPAEVQAAREGATSSAFQLLVQSGVRMRGTVTSWVPDPNRRFGSISPELPLFLAEGVMGPSAAVFTGDVFCAASNINMDYKVQSLAVGQDVMFVAKWHKKKMKATNVCPVDGVSELRGYVVAVDAPVRPGEGVRRRVNGAQSICMMHLAGRCTNDLLAGGKECEDGVHVENPYPGNDDTANTLTLVGAAKLKLLQDQVDSAGGKRNVLRVLKAWQLRNDSLEFRFRCTEYNMAQQKMPDMIDGFHGSAETNMVSIATTGFDPLTRKRQLYGEGEYFAENPLKSVSYAGGGGYMFVCNLILGKEGVDHTWKSDQGYFVIKQNNGHVQCLPRYLIQFKDTGDTELCRRLSAFATDEEAEEESLRRLGQSQAGGERPCKGRPFGCMMAESTSRMWVGWLDPDLGSDAAVRADVCEFLKGYDVKLKRVDRNGARLGAYVEFATSLTQAQVAELNTRPYGKESHQISVDDTQPENPYKQSLPCPRLHGQAKYCRGWNLRERENWTATCSYNHEADAFPLASAELKYETLAEGSVKYEELAHEVVAAGVGRVDCIRRVVNTKQAAEYERHLAFLTAKYGNVSERELWHGTSCAVLDTVLKGSLQPPSDTNASDSCPVSGRKGLSTTLCGSDCRHCTEPHQQRNMCHMYGHGIYFADRVEKSHSYVRPHKGLHSLVRCRVNLGKPFLIDSNLKQEDGTHHMTYPKDPTELLENNTDTWDTVKGHSSYLVKGQGSAAKKNLGSEYVLFHPSHVLPLYVVDYHAPVDIRERGVALS